MHFHVALDWLRQIVGPLSMQRTVAICRLRQDLEDLASGVAMANATRRTLKISASVLKIAVERRRIQSRAIQKLALLYKVQPSRGALKSKRRRDHAEPILLNANVDYVVNEPLACPTSKA